jgi:hypothetical protein
VGRSTDELHEAAHHPRYFLMVSALDFNQAAKHNPVLLWCARVGTELVGRDLGDVLPALVSAGAPLFGEDMGSARFMDVKAVPMGHVHVGTPVLKPDYPDTNPKNP